MCAGGRRPARSPSALRVVACCPDRSPAAARPARPLAVRAASFARRVGSKPGQAPQASRRPPIGRGVCVLPGQAPPPPTGTAAGPFGALHTGGAVSRPDLTCRIAETVPNFARNSPATISNIEFVSLELQRFVALLNVHPIELRAKLRYGVYLLWSSLLLRGIALLTGVLRYLGRHCTA